MARSTVDAPVDGLRSAEVLCGSVRHFVAMARVWLGFRWGYVVVCRNSTSCIMIPVGRGVCEQLSYSGVASSSSQVHQHLLIN